MMILRSFKTWLSPVIASLSITMIEASNLTKRYYRKTIFENLSFKLESGRCYLLVGENGSGKTTLIKALLGLIKYQGEIKITSTSIGYIPERFAFPDFLTVTTFISLLVDHANSGGVIKSLKEWDMDKKSNTRIGKLSKGMKQKLLIISALISDNDIYIFDEALNGLDPYSQQLFIQKILSLKKANKLIIITSHYPELYQNVIDCKLTIKEGILSEEIM